MSGIGAFASVPTALPMPRIAMLQLHDGTVREGFDLHWRRKFCCPKWLLLVEYLQFEPCDPKHDSIASRAQLPRRTALELWASAEVRRSSSIRGSGGGTSWRGGRSGSQEWEKKAEEE